MRKLNHSKLKSFFIGTLLGDSYIINGSFYCKQISKDLIYFKKAIIEKYLPNVTAIVTEHAAYTDSNGVVHQKYYQLRTYKHRYFSKLEKIFYTKDRIKRYPPKSVLKLDPLGFAMWFADDGTTILVNRGKSRRVQICTDNFTFDEQQMIANELKQIGHSNIKIINRCRNNQFRIQINTTFQQFICSISDYFYNYFPSLLYKMDLGYRGRQLTTAYVSQEYRDCYSKISAHPQFKDRLSEDDIV